MLFRSGTTTMSGNVRIGLPNVQANTVMNGSLTVGSSSVPNNIFYMAICILVILQQQE